MNIKQAGRLIVLIVAGIIAAVILLSFQNELEFFFLGNNQSNAWPVIVSIADTKPLMNKGAERLELDAVSAIAVNLSDTIISNASEKILFEKNSGDKIAIASLTKLASALIVLNTTDLNQIIVFSEQAAKKEGEVNFYHQGESFYARDLLYSSLIESSNRATFALAESFGGPARIATPASIAQGEAAAGWQSVAGGEKPFVDLLNSKAVELEMKDTFFVNSTGLDPDYPNTEINYSSARDLVILAKELLKNPFIFEISPLSEFDIYDASGKFHHRAVGTNELLSEITEIVFGKTGTTPMAGKCLLLVLRNPSGNGYLVNVILNSSDHFGEMRKLIEWEKTAYRW